MCSVSVVTVVFIYTMEDDQRLNTVVHEGDALRFTIARSLKIAVAFWRNFSEPAALSVVQIEPMRCQAIMCRQFCPQRSPDRQQRQSR